MGRTLYDKLVDSHTVATLDESGDTVLLYIDRHTKGERHDMLVYVSSGFIGMFGVYWLLQRIGVLPG